MCPSTPNRHDDQQRPPEQQLPVCIEAVLELNLPHNIVISAHQQLRSEGYRDVTEAGSDAEAGAARGDDNNCITAALLLITVDALIKSDFAASPGCDTTQIHLGPTALPYADSLSSSAGVVGVVTGSGFQDDGQGNGSQTRSNQHTPQHREQTTGYRSASEEDRSSSLSAPEGTHAQAAAASVVSTLPPRVSSPGGVPVSAVTVATHTTEPQTVSQPASSSSQTANTQTTSATPPARIGPTPRGQRAITSTEDSQTRERRRQLERLRVLRAENRRLKEKKMCRQCRQRPVDLTLLPCGHFCFCQQCGSSFSACPLCRKTILADVRTFVS
ncbi:uncharacterized protein [Littorina saxatilis]|uniref:RING-type domain-containing protein n=1 Tax=Littorina saxatilis TaxID=31220 RepID=A0AAN9APF2_9CAEN